MAKDAVGQPLEVGDHVACMFDGYSSFVVAEVIKLSKAKCGVTVVRCHPANEFVAPYSRSRMNSVSQKWYTDVVKIPK